jgi:hypothetical protein
MGIDLVTEHEREMLVELLEADEINPHAAVELLVQRSARIMADARAAIRAKPFGGVILALLDFELRASRVWWKIRDRVRGRRYSARH